MLVANHLMVFFKRVCQQQSRNASSASTLRLWGLAGQGCVIFWAVIDPQIQEHPVRPQGRYRSGYSVF